MIDNLGNRMKKYESNIQLDTTFPIYARIDGKAFSKLTKNLSRPYCEDFHNCMIETTKYLVDETNAIIGYTQSDEISLGWYNFDPNSQIWFNGKIQKTVSVLSGMASVKFNERISKKLPSLCEHLPVFDARVMNIPSLSEFINAFIWREIDCNKNAINMVSRCYFSHKSLLGVKNDKMKEKLLIEKNIDFEQYPNFFKFGTWVKKQTFLKQLDQDTLNKIPEKYRINKPVKRSCINSFSLNKPLSKHKNKKEIIFG